MTLHLTHEAEELLEMFSMLDDWEDRYRLIIDMGKQLEPLPDEMKVEANRVHGCQSTVYMTAEVDESTPPRLIFRAESDAAIVNGLIAILKKLYSNRPAADILAFDADAFLRQLGLDEHLSPTRRNGLYEMVKRIRALAHAHQPPTA